jgi:hypothetical protein
MVVLHALQPKHERTRGVLNATRDGLGWKAPLELGPDNRVEIMFLSVGRDEALYRVRTALDGAGADWTDYFTFPEA